LTAGLLLRSDDRWIVLAIGALILAIEVGVWRPPEAKRGLVEVVLSGAVTLTAIARLAETIDRTFTVNHVYLVLALVGSLFLLVEGYKRSQPSSESER
jgi:di/tricarboxylate transporter